MSASSDAAVTGQNMFPLPEADSLECGGRHWYTAHPAMSLLQGLLSSTPVSDFTFYFESQEALVGPKSTSQSHIG